MTRLSRTAGLATIAAVSIIAAGASAFACDVTSPTDISCGPANLNPTNPLSSLNPASPYYPASQQSAFPQNQRNPATDPNSPYFSQPTYADGIFGLFESNPRIVYPAGPVQTCRLGLDCPANVARSPGATLYGLRPVAQTAPDAPAYPETPAPVRHHRRRHPATR